MRVNTHAKKDTALRYSRVTVKTHNTHTRVRKEVALKRTTLAITVGKEVCTNILEDMHHRVPSFHQMSFTGRK